jgi:hypothetical protein
VAEYPYHCDVCGCRVLDYGFHVHVARMRVVEVARAWRRDDVSGLEHLSLRHSLFAAVDHLDELLVEQAKEA